MNRDDRRRQAQVLRLCDDIIRRFSASGLDPFFLLVVASAVLSETVHSACAGFRLAQALCPSNTRIDRAAKQMLLDHVRGVMAAMTEDVESDLRGLEECDSAAAQRQEQRIAPLRESFVDTALLERLFNLPSPKSEERDAPDA